MYEVDKNNNITATRGDAQKYSLDLKDPEGRYRRMVDIRRWHL